MLSTQDDVYDAVYLTEYFSLWLSMASLWNTNRYPCRFLCLTLAAKSGGKVLTPVRRFTRKAFQLEYLCCMAVREIIKTTAIISTNHTKMQKRPQRLICCWIPTVKDKWAGIKLTFWRYEGLAARSAPSHWVHFRDTEITPEVFAGVVVKALIPQESLEPWRAIRNTTRSYSNMPFIENN